MMIFLKLRFNFLKYKDGTPHKIVFQNLLHAFYISTLINKKLNH